MHLVFNRATDVLKLYDDTGIIVLRAECRNDAVEPGYGHDGMCPDGEYTIGEWVPLDPPEVPYGAGYVTINDPNGLWAKDGRAGIYLHGGGSGLADSFAPYQGWVITEGCFRLQNADLAQLVRYPIAGIPFTVA